MFLKGYQWPFDVRKKDGSSRIDIAVSEEIRKGNRVYLDFRNNPSKLSFSNLGQEAYQYLKRSEALFGTPIERLERMNPAAAELYRSHEIDLKCDLLEIAVCAQHCNGGVAVDANWESSIKGLYAVGEAAGNFGTYRPGGSALNAAQVGSMRAAEHIARSQYPVLRDVPQTADPMPDIHWSSISNLREIKERCQAKMSVCAAQFRNISEMEKLKKELSSLRSRFYEAVKIKSSSELPELFKTYDMLLVQISMLSAMLLSAKQCGSYGGAWIDDSGRSSPRPDAAIITQWEKSYFEPVRPIPDADVWFETVWKDYNGRWNR